jgi:hypothetical protein
MPTDTALHPALLATREPQLAAGLKPLYGVIALAVSLGVQWMLIGFVAWGRIAHRVGRREFTLRAWNMTRPERDLPIYVAGICLTLAMAAIACWGWCRPRRPIDEKSTLERTAAVQVALAVAGFIALLLAIGATAPLPWRDHRPPMAIAAGMGLCCIGVAMAAVAALDSRFGFFSRSQILLRWAGPVLFAVSILGQLAFAPIPLQIEMIAVLAIVLYRTKARRNEKPDLWKSNALRRSAILAAMGGGCFAIYLMTWLAIQPVQGGALAMEAPQYRDFIPLFAMAICVLLDIHSGRAAIEHRRQVRIVYDVVVPLLIFAILFIPRSKWMILSGGFLQNDELHHWNYFALGPAMAFARGRALVTQVYSQYGVAWPVLFAVLRHQVRLTYANLIGCGMLYGCLYFVALYAFLRLLLRDSIWAACGVVLAITLQIFSGVGEEAIVWDFPSSTMLRHPLDIAFFLVLLGHQRWGNRKWFVTAGALCGLAVLFELDTGIDLLIILCFYWLLERLSAFNRPVHDSIDPDTRHGLIGSFSDARQGGGTACNPPRAKTESFYPAVGEGPGQSAVTHSPRMDLLTAVAAAAFVWLMGMMFASRGTILHRAFWSEYLEGLRVQAFSGLGLIPIADDSGYALAVFGGILMVYLFAIALSGARIWLKISSELDFFLATISAYGLGLLLLFVGRSHPFNLFHPMVPLALVVVLLLYNFRTSVFADVKWTSFPWVLLLSSLAMLLTKPEFAIYPSVLQSMLIHDQAAEGSLSLARDDLGGLSLTHRKEVPNTRLVVSAIDHLPAHDGDIAILDDRDTLLSYLSDRIPWSRYTSVFHSLLTWKLVAQTQRELLRHRPRYIVMRAAPPPKGAFNDTWASFHQWVPRHYHLEKTVAGYEFWRLAH